MSSGTCVLCDLRFSAADDGAVELRDGRAHSECARESGEVTICDGCSRREAVVASPDGVAVCGECALESLPMASPRAIAFFLRRITAENIEVPGHDRIASLASDEFARLRDWCARCYLRRQGADYVDVPEPPPEVFDELGMVVETRVYT